LLKQVPLMQLNGPPVGTGRISTNLNLSTEFIEGEGQLLLCDMQGIAIGSGPACLSKALKVSHVLQAIGLDHGLAVGNVMFSLGKDNTAEEMDYVLDVFRKIVHKLRNLSPLWEEFQRGGIDSVIQPRQAGI
jgi:cysteine desulfurase